ncbi:unnamed protein product [Clonostachys byssicola]|uniref:Uncharacterized protein n=1 Tax=Clonostachys byssicola TaxID=160290 RepID=A0A9N9UWX4_9HYPO|nr:unnamed protein product [Clonostachys byssicola]
MSTPLPGAVRIVSDNILPLSAGFNEPIVKTTKDTVETLPAYGGQYRRAFIGKHAFPATNDGEHIADTDPDVPVVNPGGVRIYHLDLSPGFVSPMHRTTSVDYLTVQKGKPILVTPKGPFNVVDGKADYTETIETVCNEGETIVQRGQFHAWKNDSEEWIRIFVVAIEAQTQEVKVGNETKRLEEIWL